MRDVRTNREALDKANKKPFEEARKSLEALSTKLIKEGKAEDAGVVLKQVETLESDLLREANAPPPVPAPANAMAELRAIQERRAAVVRTLCTSHWKHLNTWTCSFTPDGEFELVGTPRRGKYLLADDARTVVMRWEGEGTTTILTAGEQANEWKFGDSTTFRPLPIGPE